jgi:hypothetical protein
VTPLFLLALTSLQGLGLAAEHSFFPHYDPQWAELVRSQRGDLDPNPNLEPNPNPNPNPNPANPESNPNPANPNPNPNPNQVRSRLVELDHSLVCLEDLGEAFVSPPELGGADSA